MERDIRLKGQLLDDHILSRVLDAIGSLGGEYEIRSLVIGRTRPEPSEAVIRLLAPDGAVLMRVV